MQVLAQTRMDSLMQLSRALMEAKQEKESAVAQALIEAKTERLENAADAKQQELLKVCVKDSGNTQRCKA